MKYKAKCEYGEVIVDEEEFLHHTNYHLLSKLNEHGFRLGSGHEESYVKKNSLGEYVLTLSPYTGHVDQVVIFKPIEI